MKSYPSIQAGYKTELDDVYVFEKLDGSNFRAEWNKHGWYKFGTRTQLLSPTDPTFGPAIPLFHEKLSEPLTKIAKDSKWESVVVFGEYFGPSSFAGQHIIGESMDIKIFDISPYKQGMLTPQQFIECTKNIEDLCAGFIGIRNWDKNLIEQVKNGSIGVFEGVVGKKLVKREVLMLKAKSNAWIEKVKSLYSPIDAERIISS
jgi:hypothetical protein